MDEESDEDVYFANSPLMKHLEEAGIDIKDETVIQSNKPDTVKKENTSKIHFSTQLQCWFSYVYCFIISVLGINILKEEKTNLENLYKEKLLLLAVKSKAFEQDDQQFLENFKEKYEEKKQPNMDLFIKSKMLTMIALPCLLAYLFSRVVYPDLPWKYKTLTDFSAICSLLYIIANIVKYFLLIYQRWKLEHMYDVVVNCIQTGETMVKYTQKSLRLIQESELVSRGFTLVSQKSPLSRLEQNSLHHTQRQCSQLRSELFHSARNCFLVLKSAATNLVTSCPLDASIDNVMNYLCHIPIEEFGQCLQITGDTDESTKQLYTLTDGFSVASLKGLKHLFHLQQSEFLRRLTLTFIESDTSLLNTRPEISNIISNVTSTLQNNTDQLQRSYNIHSCCAISQETQSVRAPASQTSATSDVYIAVHSLDLHLQAALLRIRSLSTIMEHQLERAEDSSNEFDQSGDSLLQQIKQELLACKGCWEEGLSRVENLLKSKEEPVQKDSVKTETLKPLEPKPLKQCGLEDPVIEDEVFEAYNNEDEEDMIENTWDEFLSPEEKAKKKREKEEALRVLTELKSVISFRAQDTAKREQAALQKSKGTESHNNVETDKVEHALQETKPDNQYKDLNQKEKLEEEENTFPVQDCDKTNAEKSVTPGSNNEEHLNSEITVNTFNSINTVDSQSQYEKNQNSESIIRPKKQKYVYCPPEDEMNNSTETITGPQFIALPVLGRQDGVEDRLERLSGANLSFTAMLAAQAVAQSQKIGLNVQTFGDDDGDELIYDDDSFDEEDKSEDSLDHDNDDNDSLNHDDSENDSLKDNHHHDPNVSLRKDKVFNDSLQTDYDNDSLKGDHVCNDANHDKHDDHDSDDSLEPNDVEKHQCGEDSNLKND
ncbi:vezatin-like [Mytilus edulis]|uniref:vezatin-like n=1 Tax=Mytilus edulis TaxID=6550 RepID=UPI0039F12CCD